MNNRGIRAILRTTGAVLTNGHFIYTSGKHGHTYVNKDAIFPHPYEMDEICWMMAELHHAASIDAVLGPAIGGALLAQGVARHVMRMKGSEVMSIYADKGGKDADGREKFAIKRGYDALIRGKRVLIVEDVLTTGESVRSVAADARGKGADIIGVVAICNRGGVTAHDVGDAPKLDTLVSVALDTFEADACPLCAEGVPINVGFGKGKEYLEQQNAVQEPR